MTLLEEIRAAFPGLTPETRDDGAIAAALSVGRTKIQSRMIGIGTILATLGDAGGAFLDGLVAMGAADRSVYWTMELIKAGTLDVGMQATRDKATAIAEANPTIAPAVQALLALGVVPDTVSPQGVSKALEGWAP
jgi:hypothetical protein